MVRHDRCSMLWGMSLRVLGPLVAVLSFGGACYQEYQQPTTPQPYFEPQPILVQGPPGGGMDPETADVTADEGGGAGGVAATVDVTGTVTDTEIDATLEGYGTWVEDEEYGRIWRPSATVVGVDFTPYETCGTWVWTDDQGWTFSCDYDWGWLPFHYGNWGWFDDYWAWVPDYTWSPAWVEWRSGGGYVGWRPIGPSVRDHRPARDDRDPNGPAIVRDHRNAGDRGPIVRDHRGLRTGEADWRFVADRDLGRRIRPALVRNNAEGLRATTSITRPPMGASPHARSHLTHAADLMQHRVAIRNQLRDGSAGGRPSYTAPSPGAGGRPYRPRPSTFTNPSRPSYTGPAPSYDGTSRPAYDGTRPSRDGTSRPSYNGTYVPPSRPQYEPTRPSYTPSRPSMTPSAPSPYRPSYTPSRPSMTPSAPSHYTPPSRPSYTPSPSRPTYTPSAPTHSYSPPSRPSSSSSSSSSSSNRGSSSSGHSFSGRRR
jgi:hypothetical protein